MYCKNCGRELQPGHAFCGACGTPAPKADPQDAGVKFGDDFALKSQTPTYTPPSPQWQAPPKSAKKKDWKLPVIIGLCAVLVVLLVIAVVFVVDFLRPEPMIDPGPPETITIDPKPHTSTDPELPEEPEVPEAPGNSDGPLVTDAFYDDSHSTSYGGGVFAIPQINLGSNEIRAINDEIYQELYTNMVAGLLRNWDDSVNGSQSITYTWTENGDTLSLLIEEHPMEWDWTHYYVYNISISEERELSKQEVIDRSDVTNYYKTARQALESKFWGSYEQDWLLETPEMVDFFNQQLDATRANSNIEKAQPYFNRKGELCIAADIYSMAGAAYYTQEVNLEDFYYEDRYAGYAEAAVSDDDYIIPDSDTRKISESELYRLSEHESWLALNEIYARHGRLFARQEFADYFESKPWYNGYIDGSVFDANANSYLNSTEQANIATIVAYQKKMGWR